MTWFGGSGGVARVLALCAYAVRSNLRSRVMRIGVAAMTALAVLGRIFVPPEPGSPSGGDRLFGYAFLLGAVFVLRSGLAEHRQARLGEFLRHNLLSPAGQAAGHALALVGQLALHAGAAFLLAAAVTLGDLRFAAWYTAVLTLATALFLPLVLLVEMVSDLRLPFVLVPVLLAVAVAAAAAVGGADRLLEGLGLQLTVYEPVTLLPLLLRVIVALPTGFGVAVLIAAARYRRRGAG